MNYTSLAMVHLDDVRTALMIASKGIRMEYLPQTFWSQRDKANARAMIQAIDKRLNKRIQMRETLRDLLVERPYREATDTSDIPMSTLAILRRMIVGFNVYLIQRLKKDGLKVVMIQGTRLDEGNAPETLEASSYLLETQKVSVTSKL
ncbi:hypothetical protein Tco_1502379 [Tanacetum coccineum]